MVLARWLDRLAAQAEDVGRDGLGLLDRLASTGRPGEHRDAGLDGKEGVSSRTRPRETARLLCAGSARVRPARGRFAPAPPVP